VLLDADSGGDATWLLGFRSADTALDVLRGRKDLTAAVSSTTEGIRLLASSPRLIELETADVNVLAERLRRLSDRDLIVADLPPGFSPAVTRAAILAATTIVVPIIPEPLAERRARHVLDAAEALGSTATILALAVMVDKRRVLTGAVLATAQEGGLDVVGEFHGRSQCRKAGTRAFRFCGMPRLARPLLHTAISRRAFSKRLLHWCANAKRARMQQSFYG